MSEKLKTVESNPIKTLAYLMREATMSTLYIEQQDIYPLESQRAAVVLPVVEESIEELTSRLSDSDVSMARKWAGLLLRGPSSNAEGSGKGEF